MQRRLVTVVGTFLLFTAAASAAEADAGTPGSTFPEQPGGHVQPACAAIGVSPGFATAPLHRSATANAITEGLYTDACVEN
jgi:hypothetical protein